MFIHTKIALLAFVIPFAASAAIANDLESTGKEQTANAFTCPWLEGHLRGFSRDLTIACRFRTVRMAVSIPVRPIVSTTNHVGVISAITIGSVLLQPPATLRGAGAEDRARPNRDSIPILLQLILEPTAHFGPGAMR